MIRVATCFEPTGSSSGLHYEPVNCKAAYILGIPTMFTSNNLLYVDIVWDPNNV